jgi:two-component system, sensor histidine kinase and response regulator
MKRILIIDDADYILEATSTLLRFEGFEVYTASDGAKGIESAINLRPDMILCDVSMPVMDGYGVLKKIRENSATKIIPFIFLTAFSDKSNHRAGMESGADDYLFKPFTRDELLSAIEAQFKKSSIIEEKFQEKVDEINRNITYSLPHEFRTVLNQVKGSAKYINNNYEVIQPDDLKELSNDILLSVQRLNKITENYLIYTKIESFASSLEKRKQLRNFVTDEPGIIVTDIAQSIAVEYSRVEDLIMGKTLSDVKVEMSSDSFYKIISELIDNAFKFSNVGDKVTIDLSYDSELFFMMLKDEGRGMTNEQVLDVGAYMQFERKMYEQQGVGLGLVLSKKLIELHDGIFSIFSQSGKGTEIKISLPASMNV